jgi:hypothetical protein
VREIVSVTLRETELDMDVVPDGVIDSADREVDAETVAEGGREGELAVDKECVTEADTDGDHVLQPTAQMLTAAL